ncbi:ACP phosphodiesterase [Dyella sp. A6]|uniref:acyl carrier protein phosphodiesterase n=1 Tax=Dyella aluminiiresistens TaxID=3069105 RepID=UPI002E781C82|nr:ACP phosphodiesterase [Dyella sp. A6]
MNHLAHTLLAGDDDGLRLGGLMGDFVRGAPDPSLPPEVVAGIRLHRAIDVFTDRHPEVVAAHGLFEPPYRRYAGILLDMWFDHCLARDFARWSEVPLAEFSAQVRALLRRRDPFLPQGLRRFRAYMEAHDLPAGYARRDELGAALQGISQRLQRANPLGDALPVLVPLDQRLKAHFSAFFPELRAYAQAWIRGDADLAPAGPDRADNG